MKLARLWNNVSNQKGVALVIALLIMLALVLLGFALILQSNTESLISTNESESFATLNQAEGQMNWARHQILAWVKSQPAGTTFTPLFNGPDGDPAATGDNHMLGYHPINPALGPADLNSANENTTSVVDTPSWDPQGRSWEVYRLSDGPGSPRRTLVYMRLDDNYDDGPTNDDMVDTDLRITLSVVAEYPVFVRSDGTVDTKAVNFHGLARRWLTSSFGPGDATAVRTSGDLSISGSFQVCGECGSVEGNQDLTIGASNVQICSNAYGGETANINPSATIGGDQGVSDPVYIPVINPYSPDFVPAPSLFNHTADPELAGATYAFLRSPGWSAGDPGATKYFAFVVSKNGSSAVIWKAYWDAANNYWRWRAINDVTAPTHKHVKLDDFGRVANCDTDTLCTASGGPDPNATAPVTGSGDFYGFNVNKAVVNVSCSSDVSLAGTSYQGLTVNDSSRHDFPLYPSGSNGVAQTPTLPNKNQADGQPDFVIGDAINKTKAMWSINANTIFSPLYNAVIFVYGNVSITGSPTNLNWSGGSSLTPPGNKWRVTIIAFNDLDTGGTPAYAPAAASFPYLFIAGRDVNLQGNAGGGSSNFCPTSGDCADPILSAPGYAGVIAAHEQIRQLGNAGLDGLMVAEDHATCLDDVNDPMTLSGSGAVHYDCDHPPDPWKNQSVRMQSWQEMQ